MKMVLQPIQYQKQPGEQKLCLKAVCQSILQIKSKTVLTDLFFGARIIFLIELWGYLNWQKEGLTLLADADYPRDSKYEYRQIHYPGQQSVPNYYVNMNGKYVSKPASSLLNKDYQSIIGRTVVGYNFNLGSSGGYPGDPAGLGWGFLGLLLQAKNNSNHREWMVITIGSAARYNCLLDSRWIESFKTDIQTFKPTLEPWHIQGHGFRIDKDEFSSLIKGCLVTRVDLQSGSCKITLEKDGQKHLLEILNVDSRLCPLIGPYDTNKKIVFHKTFREGTDHIGNYIIFMEEDGQIFV